MASLDSLGLYVGTDSRNYEWLLEINIKDKQLEFDDELFIFIQLHIHVEACIDMYPNFVTATHA